MRVSWIAACAVSVVACSTAGTPTTPGGVSSVRTTVQAGGIDSLVLGAGVTANIDNHAGTAPVTVELAPAGPDDSSLGNLALSAFHLRVTGSGSTAGAGAREGQTLIPITLFVTTIRQAGDAVRAFLLQDAMDPTVTPLWNTPTGTDFTDPKDGSLHTVDAVKLQPPTAGATDYLVTLAALPTDCDLPPRLIDLDPGVSDPSRIPLILIHGWQANVIRCRPVTIGPVALLPVLSYEAWDQDDNHSPFDAFLSAFASDQSRGRYHVYVMHYPTYAPIAAASGFLSQKLSSLGGPPAVIVAHSMGGLVARGMMSLPGAPTIRGLITLGTPHEGSVMAGVVLGQSGYAATSVVTAEENCGLISGLETALGTLAASPYPPTSGLSDMVPGGVFVREIADNRPNSDRVYTIGAQIGPIDLPFGPVDCVTKQLTGQSGDGVVEVSSAVPGWSAGQQLVSGIDHTELPSDPRAIRLVEDALSRFASCQGSTPPPTPPGGFPLSGSIARESGGLVDVTLNGIVINGVAQTNIPASAFTIVENGCTIPAGDVSVTTGTGHVGVDLVFIEDLSGSMNAAIASVRSSVTTFAQSLAAQGLDVRFGSVGYSGSVSTIPSTPAGSPDEYIGPVQDLTDVATFRQHVADHWYSGGGNDVPENGLEAIEYAMNHLTWRSGAVRVLVDITNSSHHVAGDSCDGAGPCTDENLASITALLAGRAVLHAVAPADPAIRTADGGLDPWLIAAATGGKSLDFGSGVFDLNTIGITDAIAATTRLTFQSASRNTAAPENLRILVSINGVTAELAPGLLTYRLVDPALHHAMR